MRLIETTQKYVAASENEAKEVIEKFRAQATEKGYTVKKAGFEYRKKTKSGEIIAEAWVCTIVMIFSSIWEE